MCGITGMIGSDIRPAQVEQAAALQQHRGPDNFKSVSSAHYCFCHNRLSIIDLSANSNQPLENDSGILVFNGEIYNFRELSSRYLSDANPASDTRVLSALLQRKGSEILTELDGMFTFCWYDKTRETALLARDRMGIKPLYYAEYAGSFLFASEMKTAVGLLECCTGYRRENDFDREFVDECILSGHAESGRLPFKLLREFRPGTSMTVAISPLRCETAVYYSIPETIIAGQKTASTRNSLARQTAHLDDLLNRSVQMHLIADAPVGILCSGGVDSSLITAMAARSSPSIAIYHAAIEGERGELEYARMVARHCGLELKTIFMNAEKYLTSLPDTIYHLDNPMYHPSDVSLYHIAARAHADGIKALLCGEGADELFGGYGWHVNFARTLRHFRPLAAVASIINMMHRTTKTFRYADKFDREEYFSYSGNYLTYSADNIVDAAKRGALLRNRASWETLRQLRHAYEGCDGNPLLAALCTNNLYDHLSTLLQRNDRMCMMANIESRVPFLENSIIDFALTLDSAYKIRGRCGKFILKKCAERHLPRPVIYRKKAGFPIPWKKYLGSLNHDLFRNGFCEQHLEASRDDMNFLLTHDADLLYTLLTVEIWGRLFVRREKPDDIRNLLLRKSSCRD